MGEMTLRMMISPPSTAALISPQPTPIRQMNLLLVFSTPSTTTTSSSKRMIPLLKFSSTLSCFPRRRRVNPIPTTTTSSNSSLGNSGIIRMSRRVVPARDRVIDFGKYKGKMLGSLPSSYLKWVTKNLRAGDSVEWANLADEVLSDPIYRDRIEWELAEKVLNGDSSVGHNSSWEGGAVSELLEISERFGWDNEDKGGWSKIDFGLLGTSKGGRIPRRRQRLKGGEYDDVYKIGGGGMKKTKKGEEEEISEEDKRGRGGRTERRERVRMRRQRRGEESGSGTSSSIGGGTRSSMRIRMHQEMEGVGGYGNRKEVEISSNSNKGGQAQSQSQSESESVKKKKEINNDEDEEGDRGNGDGAAAAVVGSGRSPFPGREALLNKLLLLNRQR